MKRVFFIILVLSCYISNSQEIFNFEKKIDSIENYHSIEIPFIDAKEDVTISGTLITPKTDYSKIVIIAPGSGENTRYSHYDIAEGFLKNGIAVYRYDDRGVGKSDGKYKKDINQNIDDLCIVLKGLNEVDALSDKTIGLLGHSNGGYASVNVYSKGLQVDFIILMSTPIEKNGKFLNHKLKTKNGKISFKEVYKSLNIPVLFITGTNDSVVDHVNTIKLLKELNNPNIEIKLLEGLNHFLRKGYDDFYETKDYKHIYEINEEALRLIINWTKRST